MTGNHDSRLMPHRRRLAVGSSSFVEMVEFDLAGGSVLLSVLIHVAYIDWVLCWREKFVRTLIVVMTFQDVKKIMLESVYHCWPPLCGRLLNISLNLFNSALCNVRNLSESS